MGATEVDDMLLSWSATAMAALKKESSNRVYSQPTSAGGSQPTSLGGSTSGSCTQSPFETPRRPGGAPDASSEPGAAQISGGAVDHQAPAEPTREQIEQRWLAAFRRLQSPDGRVCMQQLPR